MAVDEFMLTWTMAKFLIWKEFSNIFFPLEGKKGQDRINFALISYSTPVFEW